MTASLRRVTLVNLAIAVVSAALLALTLLGPAARDAARAAEPGVPVVLIATGQSFPDALAGGALAALNGAPMLFVSRDAIPESTRTELQRLVPQSIVILGGEAAVSKAVEDQLAALTTGDVTRLSGSDRFATAVEISKELPSRAADSELLQGLGPDAFAASGDVYTKAQSDSRYYTRSQVDAMASPRAYGRVRVIGVIPSTSFWNMAFDGPHPGFLSARTPGGGISCLKPDPAVLTSADVMGGFLQDASGNDTRLYFNGAYQCDADEVRVVQKSNFDSTLTNQSFNVVVP